MRVLIIAYVAFIVVCGGFGLMGLYHSRKYRCQGDKTHLGSIAYIVIMVAIVVISFVFIGTTDWSAGATQ